MKIEKCLKSRLSQTNVEDSLFGSVFTDHMYMCDFIDGKWTHGKIEPFKNIELSPASHVFHYAQAVFEGMKAYKNDKGKVFLFRPYENYNRINISAERLMMPAFPKEEFHQALVNLLWLDKDWIPTSLGGSLYIRPFMISTEKIIAARPSNSYRFMIICSPVKKYYSNPLKVQIAEKYSRAANGGVGYAKAAGNYAASFYPVNQAAKQGCDQIIWTDDSTHENIEEAGTMNLFFRINDKLITPPSSDRILDGITRKSLIDLAKHKGIDVEVRILTVTELINAFKENTLIEAFGSGTAATVSRISVISHRGVEYKLPEIKDSDSYAEILKKELLSIQNGEGEDIFNWVTQVTEPELS
ncbi:branched-chain amino acid aminotransferase [Ichthyobacterium seriolicida]|uniref:Branched-chain-amino-acid aminotransferase n=1 Tax=Ichthyobacterium seriolicida TaxID=242600 RepID=A0A1J1EC10_9FLAO|nr:branched-chain amino acid aminotransferase [Ichthyobacterium seriolicida]BAV95048.1 branched-chain amino acid aminotransferase [Ichthyobacterium seriolicida]